MTATCPVTGLKGTTGPPAPADATSTPPRTKTLAIVAIALGIIAGAVLFISYKKKVRDGGAFVLFPYFSFERSLSKVA